MFISDALQWLISAPGLPIVRSGSSRSRIFGLSEEEIADAKRLLVKTNIWSDSTIFPGSIAVITPEVAEWLGRLGVKSLGLDLPSVDPIDSKDLHNHHALGHAGVSIIESLDLSAISPGLYNFIGIPLRIVGADGSPIRAILWRD